MKRTLRVLSLAIVLVFAVAAFVACSPKPSLNFEKAKEKLEAAEYEVFVTEQGEIDERVTKTLMASKSDFSLEESDYEVLYIWEFKDVKRAKYHHKYLKYEYDCEVEKLELDIEALELELEFTEDLSDEDKADIEESLKELEDELKEVKNTMFFGRSGKIVWFANSEEIIKATK